MKVVIPGQGYQVHLKVLDPKTMQQYFVYAVQIRILNFTPPKSIVKHSKL